MARPVVPEEAHRRVKTYASRKGITLEDAYKHIILNILDENGIEKQVILNK